MFSTFRVVAPCRVVSQFHQALATSIPKLLQPFPARNTCVSGRTMAQRSITSFFKVSPPKPVVKEEKADNEKVKVSGDDKIESPVTNGTDKTSSKRPRLESSESDTSPEIGVRSPPVSSDKILQKKKVKRQRIESSGSESDISPKSATSSPEDEVSASPSADIQAAASPSSSPEVKPVIKVEKSPSPKTYASPKSKKKKPLTEPNSIKKSPSPKKVTKERLIEDSKAKTTPKKGVKKQEKEAQSDSKTSQQDEDIESEVHDLVPESEYNPAKPHYHPARDACWRRGAAVPYLALARTMELIEATSARLKMVEILSNYMRSVIVLTPDDLLPSIYMCLNRLAPAYESLELGIAETYLMKAIGQCTGRSLAQVRAAAARAGDLGAVAEQARATQRTMFAPPALSLRHVFAALQDIARMTGQASVSKKINKIQSLYVACRHSEARYLIRSLEGKLRIGLAEQSVLQALALATARSPPAAPAPARSPPAAPAPARSPPAAPAPGRSPPAAPAVLDAARGVPPERFKALVDEQALLIKTTYCECPDYARIVPVLLRLGAAALPAHCGLAPGVPLKPMLAHPTKRVADVFDRFEKEQFTCEWKYDGERAQIHVPGDERPDFGRAAVFSRNQENNTSKYPDVLRRLPALLKDSVSSCVLDCEAVAYDTATKQILPFQVLSTRKRKQAREEDIRVHVCVFVFDLLFLNGRATVRQPLAERRRLLRDHLRETEGEWQFATSKDCSSVEEVEQFMEEAMRGSCEGLMVKALHGEHSRYDIARRSHNWLKLKKDYLEGLGDTLDVVVIGAYSGRGRRAGLFGGFLLACYEPRLEEFQALCKLGTGFSDEQLRDLSASLSLHVIDAPRNYYRFVRVRDDKTPEQATSAQQIADMYLAQDQIKNTANTNTNTYADDFY